MHQVQLAVTQMFDGVTEVLGEDIPLRCRFRLRLWQAFWRAEASWTVAVENRSGIS